MKFRHIFVGIVLDAIDYLAFGFLPVIGDVVDIIGAIYFYMVLGPVGLVSAIELIPGFDILPTNILLVIYADFKGGKAQ